LLESIGIKQVTLCGDTRFDRVVQIALSPKDLPEIERFAMDGLLLVAGSTWLEDEKILLPVFPEIPGMKMIIAPHEVSKRRIAELHKMCGSRALLYSNISELTDMHNIIIIDKIGLLSSIYRFGQLAYIGGGFGKGIHNTLEAAVYGKAILFGPNYLKFKEARDMVNLEGAIEIENKNELLRAIQKILKMNRLTSMGDINRKYVIDRKGGTEKIMLKLFELGIIKVN
jgi:3-deoxy-D-manno-octulosonic-acid transferase